MTASFLAELRRRAIRGRVWMRALDDLERGILSLSSRVLDRVQSALLDNELTKIVDKISFALKSVFERRLEEFGLRRAEEICIAAVKLGCRGARDWLSNLDFARYITFMSLNMPIGWSI